MKHLKLFERYLSDDVGASVVVVENIDGNVLLLKRGIKARQQGWCLPGGRIDDGENPLEAAIREIKEETGIKVNNLVHVENMLSVRGYYVAVFYVKLDKKVGVRLSEEHDDFVWTLDFSDLDMAGNTLEFIKKAGFII